MQIVSKGRVGSLETRSCFGCSHCSGKDKVFAYTGADGIYCYYIK